MLLNASHPINQIVDQPAGRIRGYIKCKQLTH